MKNKTCTVCNIQKHIYNFYSKYSACKYCNIKRGVKRYYDKKAKISIQQKNNTKKIETNKYRNKMIKETKEKQTLKKYIGPTLNNKTT